MGLDLKLKLLDRIYRLYDGIVGAYELACRKSCAHCCTCNVTLTTLEGYRILDCLSFERRSRLLEGVRKAASQNRFRPALTTNAIARLCADGKEIPAEEIDPHGGPCPLLADNLCPVYDVRPFACRCLVSRKNCAESGCADVDDFLLSVNTVFLQVIEHLDAEGCCGNLADVLLLETADAHRADAAGAAPEGGLIRNQPLRFLFVPPEYRDRMAPILDKLRGLK